MLTLFKKYFWVFLVSMVPIVELRGAIPIGVGSGLPLAGTYITAIIGNMLPVPVIILFSKKVLLWCCKLPGRWGKPFDWKMCISDSPTPMPVFFRQVMVPKRSRSASS